MLEQPTKIVTTWDRLFIGGAWIEPRRHEAIEVVNPATEEVLGTVPAGGVDDVDAAVRAAAAALPAWAALAPTARAGHLRRLQEVMTSRQEEFAQLISLEVGTPITISRRIQVGLPLRVLRSYAELAEDFPWQETVGNSEVVRQPVGVVAAITPWNYPLHQIICKLGAALVAGCTLVLKPSQVAPLNAFSLADAAAEAGLPGGVLNVVSGAGREAGEALVRHEGVAMISFTGSTVTGKHLGRLAMARIARVALELGGKSANVVLADADLQRAVAAGVNNAFLNSGQTCSAWTRLLVPAQLQAQTLEIAAAASAKLVVGDPLDEATRLGPLVSGSQWTGVQGYIDSGIEQHARLVAGGPGRPDGLATGYFARPTIFADVSPDMRIAQEEIFGPVLSVMPYTDEDEALEIANSTAYGLAGGVWSADPDRARSFAMRMRTGQVDINGGRFNAMAPFGGWGQSGVGRELGTFGIEEFLEIKSIQL